MAHAEFFCVLWEVHLLNSPFRVEYLCYQLLIIGNRKGSVSYAKLENLGFKFYVCIAIYVFAGPGGSGLRTGG